MDCKRLNRRRPRKAAFTTPELLVALGLSAILLLGVMAFYMFSIRSFAFMLNYNELHQKERKASDLLTRDLRSAASIVSAGSNSLVLRPFSGSNITYSFDASSSTLSRSQGTNSQTVLKQIDSLNWTLYQRPTTNAFGVFQTTTNPANAKLVTFWWICSRQVNNQSDSEILQAGKVELRNQ